MRRLVVGIVAAVTVALAAAPALAQGQRDVDVDEVWPFWVALSSLVFAIGALSMWDTRRRRRGGRRET